MLTQLANDYDFEKNYVCSARDMAALEAAQIAHHFEETGGALFDCLFLILKCFKKFKMCSGRSNSNDGRGVGVMCS